jgi:hypothetical protein
MVRGPAQQVGQLAPGLGHREVLRRKQAEFEKMPGQAETVQHVLATDTALLAGAEKARQRQQAFGIGRRRRRRDRARRGSGSRSPPSPHSSRGRGRSPVPSATPVPSARKARARHRPHPGSPQRREPSRRGSDGLLVPAEGATSRTARSGRQARSGRRGIRPRSLSARRPWHGPAGLRDAPSRLHRRGCRSGGWDGSASSVRRGRGPGGGRGHG